MQNQIINLKNQALALMDQVKTAEELEDIRIAFLGRSGKISLLFSQLPKMSDEDKKSLGPLLNQTKQTLENLIREKASQLSAGTGQSTFFDVTSPGEKLQIGHLHPISLAIKEISDIFAQIGFTRVRYPEIEWDWYVFEALNMPEDHPARDEWETIFIDRPVNRQKGKMVLTAHTSNGQVREMERVGQPPIRMLNLGKCYRRQQDPTHTIMFHQFEGLVIDKNINITHLKGTLDYFARKFLGEDIKSRIRPFNFRFTKPSFEVDFTCTACRGRGCRFCKSGWVEVGGAGMVHPNVLRAGKIDPKRYSGFAFGWGVERILRLKPGLEIADIRILYNSNVEFLEQF